MGPAAEFGEVFWSSKATEIELSTGNGKGVDGYVTRRSSFSKISTIILSRQCFPSVESLVESESGRMKIVFMICRLRRSSPPYLVLALLGGGVLAT